MFIPNIEDIKGMSDSELKAEYNRYLELLVHQRLNLVDLRGLVNSEEYRDEDTVDSWIELTEDNIRSLEERISLIEGMGI